MAAPTKNLFQPAHAKNTGHFSASDWVLFCSVSLIWGASFLLIDIGLDALTPGMVTLLRVGSGAVALLALDRIRHGRFTLPEVDDRWRVAVLAIIWVAIPFTLFPLAEQRINSAVAGLLNGATPIFVAGIAALMLRQRTRGPQLIGIVVGLIGLIMVSLPSINEGASQASGVAMVVAATFCYGIAINIAAPLQHSYGAVELMSWVLAIAAVLTVPFGLYDFGSNRAEFGPISAVLVLGVVGTGVAFALMGALIAGVGSTRASLITYLVPVVALVLGVTFRDDDVAALAVAGVALVIAGAFVASRRTG
ncbi:MAG: EamA family transporter [Acidimicrobiales bacterium]|nr:EamA family transporter [Acidimicrobiales bacterium]